ncbi:Cyclic nucleotide gated channel, partial [Zostera marina]
HVREAERFSWTATRGVNEEGLLESLPENIQRDIRRHLFSFLKKVRIFTQVDDDPIFDFVSKRMRQTLYLKDTKIFEKKSPVEKIVFIVRGKVKSIGEDGNETFLSEGDVCGDELLACYLKHTSVNKDGKKDDFFWQGLRSTATVICENNVEAFCLYAADLENVNTQFTRYLQQPRVQGAIRYQSIYWRKKAASSIQREWRVRTRRLSKINGSSRLTLESYH